MQTTENYGLKKPESTDKYNVDDFNENMDIIDEKIQECFQSVSDGKALVASAITDKGVTTSQDATFAVMAENIGNIETDPALQVKTVEPTVSGQTVRADEGYDGLLAVNVTAISGNADTGDVLSGKYFNSVTAGMNAVGTMANRGILDISIGGINSNYPEVPIHKGFSLQVSNTTVSGEKLLAIRPLSGYYNGQAYTGVEMDKLGDATAEQVLAGVTATSESGLKFSGKMADRRDTTVDATAVSSDDSYTYFKTPAGCYSDDSMVRTPNSNLDVKQCWCMIYGGALNANIASSGAYAVSDNALIVNGSYVKNSGTKITITFDKIVSKFKGNITTGSVTLTVNDVTIDDTYLVKELQMANYAGTFTRQYGYMEFTFTASDTVVIEVSSASNAFNMVGIFE